ncbi:MAG TPA: hypothetical protein PLZ84_02930 [Clostridia bacterium]|nr:hypothetical protein [Clostridia bacterium]
MILFWDSFSFEVFAAFWLPALFSSLAVYLGSNNAVNGAAYPFILGSAASIAMLLSYNYSKSGGKYMQYTVLAVCLVLLAGFAVFRIMPVYRGDSLGKLNARINIGPAAGLYTTPQNQMLYSRIVEDLRADFTSRDSVAYIQCAPFAYMATDAHCASHTVWWIRLHSGRLLDYYRTNPAKKTEKIIIFNSYVGVHNDGDSEDALIMKFITDNYVIVGVREHYTFIIK